MKRSLILSLCAICGFAAVAADWTYTITSGTYPAATSGTISDGDWTFAASTAKDTYDLTLGTVSADPGADATLDFSKPITDADANSYTLVTLNPSFSTYANKTNLKTLKLPTTGLVTISKNAFNGCTSLTSVSPFLPDSVTMVDEYAFYQVPIEDSLLLKGAITVSGRAFAYSSVTNVAFGPALKALKGGWTAGCFDHCTKLITVSFDPAGSGAAFDGEGVFGYCSKLTGSLDLRGFTGLGNRPFYGYGGSVTKMALSSSISSVINSFFHSMGSLKEITFDGGVPSAIAAFFTAVNSTDHSFKDLYVIVPEEYKDAWAQYCENQTINNANSYFDTAYVTLAKSSNIYLIYKSTGGGGEKGYWVYDGEYVASTNGLWKFEASKVGAIGLVVGACVTYPETAGVLDFSQKVTNEDGDDMVFASYANTFHTGSAQVSGCDKVTSIVFSEDSTSIGANAFRGCAALAGTLTLPDLISSVGDYAFQGCTGITALKLGSNFANVSKYAFAGCTALEDVTPCFPDTLSELGERAFSGCPITNACVMNSIVTIGSSAIRETKIPSIYIGPTLKTFWGGYTNGGISYNTELTNLVFDAGITNAWMTGEHDLCYNTKLAGTIDLRGFYKINGGRPLDGSLVTNVIFSADMTSISGGILEGLSKLQSVVFIGDAPTGVESIFNQSGRTGRIKANQDVVTYVYSAHADSWKTYAANGIISRRTSTWASSYVAEEVTDLSLRRLILADPPPTGLLIFLR